MRRYTISFALGLLILGIFQFFTLSPQGQLRVYFLDVGQGDSILITYPTGERLLIDTGKDSKVFRELDKVLPWYNKTIDYVLLTHGDLDHSGMMIDILDRYTVHKVFVSEFFGQIELEQDILNKIKEKNSMVETLKRGDVFTIGTSTSNSFTILNPESNCMTVHKSENECSLVGLLTYGEHSFLFTGDIGHSIEEELIKKDIPDVDVLKVGHHGSRFSSNKEFIEKIKPEYSIISVGANAYGHPHSDVVEILNQASSTVFSTQEAATIVAASDGKNLKIDQLFDQARFFQSSVCSILLYGFDTPC